MQITIQARSFSLTGALSNYVKRRLGFALSNHGEHIQHIMVRLSDINGPRGGKDKQCQLLVLLDQLPDVFIEDIEADMYVAIDRAADRAGRTVGRRISRQRDMLRTVAFS